MFGVRVVKKNVASSREQDRSEEINDQQPTRLIAQQKMSCGAFMYWTVK